jgi:uncharacterized damage-inducible protein DinB
MSRIAELAETYLAGAAQLRDAVTGMTPEQARSRPVPGKWSTVECVAHIADFEPVFADRIKRALALDKPLVFVADESLFVKHLAYDARDLNEELAVVDVVRKQLARILRHLPDEALQRVAVHNEKGLVTVEQMVTGATKHLAGHLVHVLEKRKALGLS